ncbi:MAG TPA: hypothetical protein VFF06_37270, partial [Polyangia bacterium]|nr:hypothetical protein [Polyangia bacterium]
MKSTTLALMVLAGAGCGDPGTAQVDSFINSMAQQKCDWEFRCCTDAEITLEDGRKFMASDEGSCVPYRALELADELYIDRLAVREGRLRVDQDAAGACLDQMQNKACNTAPGMTPPPIDPNAVDPCTKVFVGNTPVGNECLNASECVDGAHCVADVSAVGRGVCVPFQHEGDICNDAADCDPKVAQLYCSKKDFKCRVRAKLDEPCEYTVDSSGKNPALPLLVECDNRLGNVYCDPTSGTCRQLPSDGEPCLSPPPPGVASSCDPDPTLQLVCDTSTGSTSGTCRAPGKLGADCSQFACAKEFYCDRTAGAGTCAALPTLGEQCQNAGYRCADPYYCNTSTPPYVCDQPAQLG